MFSADYRILNLLFCQRLRTGGGPPKYKKCPQKVGVFNAFLKCSLPSGPPYLSIIWFDLQWFDVELQHLTEFAMRFRRGLYRSVPPS